MDDEFNSIPSWKGSDESVQAKYVPRGLIYNHAAGVKTFVWLLAAGIDGNEYDDFGFIHGSDESRLRLHAPAGVLRVAEYERTYLPTRSSMRRSRFPAAISPALRRKSGFPFMSYGFARSGKAIVAYWLAAHSMPGNGHSHPSTQTFTLKEHGHPESGAD